VSVRCGSCGQGGGGGGGAAICEYEYRIVVGVLGGRPEVGGDGAEGAVDAEAAGEEGSDECGGYHAVCACYEDDRWCVGRFVFG
jgi:hypothetical protein